MPILNTPPHPPLHLNTEAYSDDESSSSHGASVLGAISALNVANPLIAGLVAECCAPDPAARPTFAEVGELGVFHATHSQLISNGLHAITTRHVAGLAATTLWHWYHELAGCPSLALPQLTWTCLTLPCPALPLPPPPSFCHSLSGRASALPHPAVSRPSAPRPAVRSCLTSWSP